MRAFVGLGSNIGDSLEALRSAVGALDADSEVRVVAASSVYATEPIGGPRQPDYVNAVVEVETSLDARGLLDACRSIEDALGRDRASEVRWGPRPIDLDVLVAGDSMIDELDLQVPHPRLAERAFVLVPLAEIAPDLEVPGGGPVRDLLARLAAVQEVRRVGSLDWAPSVSFDRAADYYDVTRGTDEETMREIVRVLRGELVGRGRCLEVGVGTGRIALPLARAGIQMAGMDLSGRMMAKLIEKAGGSPRFPLIEADATALPFADGSFGVALTSHLLHLIPAWRRAVHEMTRVIRHGGALLIEDEGGTQGLWANAPGPWTDIKARFAEEAGIQNRWPGLNATEELDGATAALGLRPRTLEPIMHRVRVSYDELIRRYEDGLMSWTWELEEKTRRRAAAAVRPWARERYGPLERLVPTEYTIVWRAYDLP